jgi:hypothetical protein
VDSPELHVWKWLVRHDVRIRTCDEANRRGHASKLTQRIRAVDQPRLRRAHRPVQVLLHRLKQNAFW